MQDNSSPDALEQKAPLFATEAHSDQRRSYTGTPYVAHVIAVADLVRSVPHTEDMIAAALLHDVLEDTATTSAELSTLFGSTVADLVVWLTYVSKPADGNRSARKHLDLLHIAKAPPAAKTIKLADLIDNSRHIRPHAPGCWRLYREEKFRLLDILQEGDATLWEQARALCE